MPEPGDDIFIDVIESVTFIGYPDGRYDPVHFTPIARRGVTATPLELPFGGTPSFLIDGSVFGGSSGSPVFLMNEGTYRSGPTEIGIGNRLVLVGLIARTAIREDELPILVSKRPFVSYIKELNLGIAHNWHAINETILHFKSNPPDMPEFKQWTPPVVS